MTSIPRLCIILGTWSGLALGVTNPLMAQSAPDLVALATSPESDEVLVKKDQTRLKGRIRSVSDSSINFKPAGGLARQLDNDGHVIVTWFGVTNAKLVAQAATDRVLLIDRLLQQVSTGDGNETDLIAKIQRTHQEVTDLLDAIPRFENQQAIDDLPLSMRLAAEHARILRLPTKGTSARPALVDRLKAAGDARKNIVSLRKRLSVVEVALQTRRFKDVQRDGPVLIQEIKERQQILRDQRASIEGYQEFRTALGLLTEMATSLAENQPLLLRQPALATLDQDLAAMSDVVRPADAQLAELPILGKPVIEALAAEFQLYQAHIKRFTRYRELTDELRTVMTGFENLVTRTTAQATVNEAQLASQIAAHETRLKSLIGALKSQEPPDLATIATRESEEFTRRSQERSALLLMRKVDMPRITQELRGLSDVRTRTVARQMLTELEARAQRLQHYLDQNRLPLPTDQTDCRNMLQIVKANMERLTSRMQEFDLNETRDEFVKQTTLMDGFLENAVDSELAVLVNRLQQVEKAIDQIEQGYRKRLEGAAATATGSEVLLRDFSKSKEQASEVIEFLALRQELGSVESMPDNLEQLAESQELLSTLKANFRKHEPRLPESLTAVRQATAEDVARLELNLGRTLAKLRFEEAETMIVGTLAQSKDALKSGDVPTAGARAYLAETQSESLGELLELNDWLAEQPGYPDRVADLKAAVKPLNEQIAMARLQERMDAGWQPWRGDEKLLLSPAAEIEWLQVESLLSEQAWDAVAQELNRFAERHPEPTWQERVAQTRAELHLQRGRELEQRGQLAEARAEYVRTTESQLEHPVVKAAAAALLNVDEQLLHSQSADQLRLSLIVTGGLIVIALMAVGVIVWQRSAQARLRYAGRCLRRARAAASAERRDALVREAAFVLAQFPADDPRVVALWKISTLRKSTHVASAVPSSETRVSTPTPVALDDVVDFARTSQAAPELIAAQCIQWLKSKEAAARPQKRRNREVREWLMTYLEPQDHDSPESLEAKVSLLHEYETAIDPRETWPRHYRLRASYQLGNFSEALEVAKSLSRERLPASQFEEWARLTASCYLRSEQWSAAEKFVKQLARRKTKIPELSEWLRTAQAGLTKTPAASS